MGIKSVILTQKTRHPVSGSLFTTDVSKHRRKVKPHNALARQGSVHVQRPRALFDGVLNSWEPGKEQNDHHHQGGNSENPVDRSPWQFCWCQPSQDAQNSAIPASPPKKPAPSQVSR